MWGVGGGVHDERIERASLSSTHTFAANVSRLTNEMLYY